MPMMTGNDEYQLGNCEPLPGSAHRQCERDAYEV